VIHRALGARSAILIPLVPAIIILIALWPVFRPIEGTGDTFQFWYVGHLVVTGDSPYDQSNWRAAGPAYGHVAGTVAGRCGSDQNGASCLWVYPPMTAWLFAPFGALPPDVGIPLLDAVVLMTALAGIVATVWTFGPADIGARAWLLTAAVASHPFAVDIRDGQFVGVLLLGVVSLQRGLRATTWPVSVAAALLAMKPHVVLALATATTVSLARARRWRTIAITGAMLATLGGIAVLRYPDALPAILERGGGKIELAWATTWAFAAAAGAVWIAALIVALACGAAVATVMALPTGLRASGLAAASAAVSLVIAPYLHPYDMLLALPLLALAVTVAAPAVRLWVMLAGAVIFVLAPWVVVLVGQTSPVIFSAYALLPTALLVLSTAVARARATRIDRT